MRKGKTIGCREALKHLFAYLDEELPTERREQIDRHLEICRSCYSRAEFDRLLKSKLREIGRGSVRAAFEKRIRLLSGQF